MQLQIPWYEFHNFFSSDCHGVLKQKCVSLHKVSATWQL